MKIVFRADASLQMGIGHLIRCHTLAEELRGRGIECSFICRELSGNLISFLIENGFHVTTLPAPLSEKSDKNDDSTWLEVSQEEDALQTIAAMNGEKPDWLIVDHYGIDRSWETLVKPRVSSLMVIDDLANRTHMCDLLLDQNFSLDPHARYKNLVPPECRLLLGPEYALLKPEYRQNRKSVRTPVQTVSRILVSFGGSDLDNISGLALEALTAPEFSSIAVDLVIGANHPHTTLLAKMAAKRRGTTLHIAPQSLASLMSQADLAIGAGGTTTWERMCAGLPSIVITLAKNQLPATQSLSRAGYVEWIGAADSVSVTLLADAVRKCIGDLKKRSEFHKKGRSCVDGFGVARIVAALLPPADKVPTTQSISILSDEGSWINAYIPNLMSGWIREGHSVSWHHDTQSLQPGDLCFYLSFSHIVPEAVRHKFKHNLVVHESALPHGKGWSPLTWQILEGKSRIPVTLLEAAEKVDSGVIYAQEWIELSGTELVQELREKQAGATIRIARQFLSGFPQTAENGTVQFGEESFYAKRTPVDSQLNTAKTLGEQFNLLRVVDNEKYPAWFTHLGETYTIHIQKKKQ